ncbi:uncharacterized protein LOC142348517 [Convolutriloba macropyga]|uniref:uncharacterized protein LOC142348517 n=1 Tax=Convolutriloba macropyga TaxID=536237 RepID=UPI003F525F06
MVFCFIFYCIFSMLLSQLYGDQSKAIYSKTTTRQGWQSLAFVIPNSKDNELVVSSCLHFSTRFCLLGYLLYSKRTPRPPRREDFNNFARLIYPYYLKLNFFSFSSQYFPEHAACCRAQSGTYLDFGQKYGLSPKMYLDRLLDFSSKNKHLNLVKATYDRNLCVNVISMVGFGQGNLEIIGDTQQAIFIFPPSLADRGMVHFFSHNNIAASLTFDWFKENVVCLEQRWICNKYKT